MVYFLPSVLGDRVSQRNVLKTYTWWKMVSRKQRAAKTAMSPESLETKTQ